MNAAAWSRPSTKRKTSVGRRRWLIRALVLIVLIDTGFVFGYLLRAAALLPDPVPGAHHQAAVVFFNEFGTHAGLNGVSYARVQHAARLYRDGLASNVICVGGRRQGRGLGGAQLMAAALRELGVPAAHIRYDQTSFDTRSNWRSARAILAELGASDPLLISSPLHLLRIRRITEGKGTLVPIAHIGEALAQRPGATWLETHREIVASTAGAVLPPERYRNWIRHWRNFWDSMVRQAPEGRFK